DNAQPGYMRFSLGNPWSGCQTGAGGRFVMRVIFHADYDHVILRAANGRPRVTAAYKASRTALTVPRDHGEAAIAAGSATEVKTPARRPVRGGALPKETVFN